MAGQALYPSSDDWASLPGRLRVLEMTLAAVVARLPQADLEEIASLLVFISNSSDAAQDLQADTDAASDLGEVREYATALLDRIARSRGVGRATGRA
ncbi:hypothetical protein [Muricoccus radiodurans]|uniref:hypothetical protein n=1 Tax=Muricoccus radiodurans TaxID=2231721 RepID=UPI003CEA98AA